MGVRPRGNLVRWMARTGVLLALTLAFESLKLGGAFTGPLVNAALFVAAVVVGIGGGVFIDALTPWVALAVGILKPPLAPAVPFYHAGQRRAGDCNGAAVATHPPRGRRGGIGGEVRRPGWRGEVPPGTEPEGGSCPRLASIVHRPRRRRLALAAVALLERAGVTSSARRQ